ncbi:type I-E CRISPR-associated protein Cas6/Cse3/CasE [Lactiplantibacillus daoliensis]|uniref:Type I-E CRISPR-associated protein Cas6/Cse3/CasE n=1 Tax=Lactiplantibacillus daoliensis TaxID=2559916 RepID=A0ABW1UJB2_9LACO|nr:type I-E CRISPR-associated protein Cas6/Cse3/CasE [Lactiplantibacillus daoliensis]
MYLSRVQIDTNNRYKTKDLTHLGAFHNWVEQSFPAEIATETQSRHLWRIDVLAEKKYLLVLSESKPDLELLAQYGVPGTAVTKSYAKLLDHIQVGQIMQFRLTANPTHTVTRPGEKQGRVMPHITVAQQREWLVKRAEKSGFQLVEQVPADGPEQPAILAFDIVNREWPMLHRKVGRGVRLSRVTFEGLLRVEDVAEFKQTLSNGLGREKAFGMGLMTVIPEA